MWTFKSKEGGLSLVGTLALIGILSAALGSIMFFFRSSAENARRLFEHQEVMELYHQLAAFAKDRDLIRRGYDPFVDLSYIYHTVPEELYQDHILLQACARRDHTKCRMESLKDQEFDFLLLRPRSGHVLGQVRDGKADGRLIAKPVTGTRDQPMLYRLDGQPCDYPTATPSETCPLQAWMTYRLVCKSTKTNCLFPEEVLFRMTFSNANDGSGPILVGKDPDSSRRKKINLINVGEEIRLPLEPPRILVTVSQLSGEIQTCLRLKLDQNGTVQSYLLCSFPLGCEEECNHIEDEFSLAKSTPHQWAIPIQPGSCQLDVEFLSFVPSKIGDKFSPCHQKAPASVKECRSNSSGHCYGNTRPCGLYLYRPKKNTKKNVFAADQFYLNPVPKSFKSLLALGINDPLPSASSSTHTFQKLHFHKIEYGEDSKQYFLAFEDGSFWASLANMGDEVGQEFSDYVALIEGDLNHCKSNLDEITNTSDFE